MLVLIDGSNLLFRVLKTDQFNLVNSRGDRTGGLFGVVKSIAKIVNNVSSGSGLPIVTWDEGIIPFRREIYSDYKKWKVHLNRDGFQNIRENDQEFYSALYTTKYILHTSILPLLNVPSLMIPGAEGDDIIAHLVYKTNLPCVIVSRDDDMMQLLVRDNIRVYKPIENKSFDIDDFIKERQLERQYYIEQFILEKSICGDSSDEIPGVPGIGHVNANRIAKLVLSQSNLNSSNRYDKLFLENLEIVERNKKLISLHHFYVNAGLQDTINNRVRNTLVNKIGSAKLAFTRFDMLELHSVKSLIPEILEFGSSMRSVLLELV